MRRLRWKRNYLTGIAWIDKGNEALVRVLAELASELQAKEHCQDMEDLYGMLVDRVQGRLVRTGSVGEQRSFDQELKSLLETQLPLPARDTAACRDCGICESTQERLMQWLEQSENAVPRRAPLEMAESGRF
nr:hypothetical protein [Gammaproteobacteria bacterium]